MNRPAFRQTLDKNRPFELLEDGGDLLHAAQLCYRYLDNLECVCVPNLWYNQTPALRAQSYMAQAGQLDRLIESLLAQPGQILPEREIGERLEHYRGQAAALRRQAAALTQASTVKPQGKTALLSNLAARLAPVRSMNMGLAAA